MNNWPYTNTHELNLDWILQVVKEFQDNYEGINQALEQAIADIGTAKNGAIVSLQALQTQIMGHINDAKNLALQVIDNSKLAALGDIDARQERATSAIEDVSMSERADIMITGATVNERIQSLINSLPSDYADIVGKLLIIGGIIQLNSSPLFTWVLGDYDGGTPPSPSLTESTVLSTVPIAGGADLTLTIKVTSDDTQVIKQIRTFSAYNSTAGTYTPLSTIAVNAKTKTLVIPAAAEYFSVELHNPDPQADPYTGSSLANVPVLFTWKSAIPDLEDAISDIHTYSSNAGSDATAGILNRICSVARWTKHAYLDANDGQVKSLPAGSTSTMSASTDCILIPDGMTIHIHGAARIAKYDRAGVFISAILSPIRDQFITSLECKYVRVSRGSETDDTLNTFVWYYFSMTEPQQEIQYKIDNACERVQEQNAAIASTTGNPVVLEGCDSREAFKNFSASGVASGENIVVCKKNIFAIRHVNGTFDQLSTVYTFNTINNTIRIRSYNGASANNTSGFSDFGEEFHTVNGVNFYHNFKFRFHESTWVSVSDNPNIVADNPKQEVTFDFGVQMRIYDGTNVMNVGTGGVTFEAQADTEYVVYFLVKEGWKGDITYSPQVEIATAPTAYEKFNGIKTPLLTTGEHNKFVCGNAASGRYTNGTSTVQAVFDYQNSAVLVNADNSLPNDNVLIYDPAQDGTVNSSAWYYIYKFSFINATPVYIRMFDKQYAQLLFSELYDGSNTRRDYTGNGYWLYAEAGTEYAVRLGVLAHAQVNARIQPIIATGIYAIQEYGTFSGKTVLYTDKDAALTVRQRPISTKDKSAANYDITKNIQILTGDRIYTPFSQIKTRGPLVSFIDDDTSNHQYVKEYHDIFTAKGVLGGYAVEIKNLDDHPADAQHPVSLADMLLDYEEEGFACLYHCYWQSGDSTRYWIKGHDDYDQALINANFMRGLRGIRDYGFSNYKYWVTPYGVNDKYIQDLAKNHGMECLINCPGAYAQEGFVSPSGNVSRWNIPRVIFGNYTTNDAWLHRAIQSAKADNGWVIIVSHVNSWGWGPVDPTTGNRTETEATTNMRNRLNALIQYCIDEGLEIVPFPVAYEQYRAVFQLNELL